MVKKPSKLKNRIASLESGGIVHNFPSKLERDRYAHLLLIEAAGEISDLERQPRYTLQEGYTRNGKKIRPEYYDGDFRYTNKNGGITVEDAKGMKTRLYSSKRKRLLYIYPDIEFLEVYRANGAFLEKSI